MKTESNFNGAQKEGVVSIIVNTLLFVLKYWAGVVSGSLALIADAWHTLSDSLSSIFVIVGARYSQKPADKKHPFGHGRTELITTLTIGIMLLLVAIYFGIEGFERLKSHQPAHYGMLAIIATVVSILLKEGLAQYAFFIGKKTGMKSVQADGWHHRSDALSSVIVIVGIFVSRYFWWIDGILGILVAILIAYSAYKIISDTFSSIIGEEVPATLIDEINDIIASKGIRMEPHHFHIHNYITHKELTFHVRLPNSWTIEQAHKVVSEVEVEILKRLNIDATIHMEPENLTPGCKHSD
ncbi:MAG: cation transporter [Bacteroidales bacterium]|nr:cation transporter [Bacteroidales bacterium]HRX30528.1 cation diffusion facilitator family transporter [Tenuifilaceae bacterium]